jgi:hypothetical protein
MAKWNLEALNERERACLGHLEQAKRLGVSFSRYCRDNELRLQQWVREPVGARLSRIERAAAWAVCGRRGTLIWRPGNGRGSAQKPTGGPICQANHAAPKLGLNIRPVRRTGHFNLEVTGVVGRLSPDGWFEFPIRRAVERHALPVGANPTRQLSLRPVVIEAVVEVTKQLEPSVQRATRWLDEYTGRNTCERRVSLEKFNAEADPSGLRGRLPWLGK